MKTRLFETFVEMIDHIPAEGILKAIDLQHEMLEVDLRYKRATETVEVLSILCFCQFIEAVLDDERVFPVKLPTGHVEFYRNVVTRLIEADKLPIDARDQFDDAFLPGFVETLACN